MQTVTKEIISDEARFRINCKVPFEVGESEFSVLVLCVGRGSQGV